MHTINEAPPAGVYSQYKIRNIKHIIKFDICFFISLITVTLVDCKPFF